MPILLPDDESDVVRWVCALISVPMRSVFAASPRYLGRFERHELSLKTSWGKQSVISAKPYVQSR